MMHRSHADNPRTGTELFQVDDRSLDYLERLVDFDEVEFVMPASGFDPGKVLQTILGRTA
jgi:hypothetical protein